MERRGVGVSALCLLCVVSLGALGAGLEGSVSAFYAPLTHVNLVIEEYEAASSSSLGRMSAGFSFRLGASLVSLGEGLELGLAGRVAFAGVSQTIGRDEVRASAGVAGLFLSLSYEASGWEVGLDLGGCRGTFSFPGARYVDLVGWGPGACLELGRRLVDIGPVSLSLSAGVRWLPIEKLVDAFGTTRVGRGMPFLDLSGLSVAVSCSWGL